PPSISSVLDVSRHNIRPGNDNQIHNRPDKHYAGKLCRSARRSQRQVNCDQPYRLVEQLQEKERQHLQWISNTQNRQRRQGSPKAESGAYHRVPQAFVLDKLWPDVEPEKHEVTQVKESH